MPETTVQSLTPEKKSSKLRSFFNVFLVILLIILLAGIGFLGYQVYLQFQRQTKNNTLLTERVKNLELNINLENNASPSGETCCDEVKALRRQVVDLENQVTSQKSKIGKADAYNAVFQYFNGLVVSHGGLTGWTEAEFQAGKTLAQKTGDKLFVDLVDALWHADQSPQLTRVFAFLKAVADGVESALK